jgi:hypothetical protein
MSHQRKCLVRCCEPGCSAERYCLGRCLAHYREMDPGLCARLRSMSKEERRAEFEQMRVHPPRPKFEWDGDEEALAKLVEKQEQEKSEAKS